MVLRTPKNEGGSCLMGLHNLELKKILLAGFLILILLSTGCTWKWRDYPYSTYPPTTQPPTTSPPTTTPPTTAPPRTEAPQSQDIVGSHSANDMGFLGLLILYSLTLYFYSQRRYTHPSEYHKKFVLRLVSFITLGYAISQTLPTELLQVCFSHTSAYILRLFGIRSLAVKENILIGLKEGGYYMIIVSPYCVGWGPIANYLALVLAVPDISLKDRYMGIRKGLPLIAFLNFLKIPLEGYATYIFGNQIWIGRIDYYLANGLLALVYITWVAWTKKTFKLNKPDIRRINCKQTTVI